MIFQAEDAYALVEGRQSLTCRPVFRRNGLPIGYRVGGIYPVQPGRYQAHVGHIEVLEMSTSSAGELRLTDDWNLPSDWVDELPLAVMRVQPAPLCERCK